MGAMATWTDGPEYAPLTRPDVFVAPDAAPLPQAEPAASPAPSASGPPPAAPPDAAPPDYVADDAGVALDAVEPPAPATRDPREPFDVASTPVTTWTPHPTSPPADPGLAPHPGAMAAAPAGNPSAWGSVHAPTSSSAAAPPWAPDQPFPAASPQPTQHLPGPSSAPLPHPAPWDPPPPPRSLQPVTLGDMARAATPGVLISLVVGGLVSGLALPLYLVASVLASRIEHRRRAIARAFSIGAFAALGAGLVSLYATYGYFDLFLWYEASLGWFSLACWVMIAFTMLTVGDALRRGERPDTR